MYHWCVVLQAMPDRVQSPGCATEYIRRNSIYMQFSYRITQSTGSSPHDAVTEGVRAVHLHARRRHTKRATEKGRVTALSGR